MSDVVVDVPQSRGGVRVEVSKRRDIVEGAVGVHDTINMTASANYHYQCPTRNHLMVVCGMPYRYAVSVLCRCGLQCVCTADDGGERRRTTTTMTTMCGE